MSWVINESTWSLIVCVGTGSCSVRDVRGHSKSVITLCVIFDVVRKLSFACGIANAIFHPDGRAGEHKTANSPRVQAKGQEIAAKVVRLRDPPKEGSPRCGARNVAAERNIYDRIGGEQQETAGAISAVFYPLAWQRSGLAFRVLPGGDNGRI